MGFFGNVIDTLTGKTKKVEPVGPIDTSAGAAAIQQQLAQSAEEAERGAIRTAATSNSPLAVRNAQLQGAADRAAAARQAQAARLQLEQGAMNAQNQAQMSAQQTNAQIAQQNALGRQQLLRDAGMAVATGGTSLAMRGAQQPGTIQSDKDSKEDVEGGSIPVRELLKALSEGANAAALGVPQSVREARERVPEGTLASLPETRLIETLLARMPETHYVEDAVGRIPGALSEIAAMPLQGRVQRGAAEVAQRAAEPVRQRIVPVVTPPNRSPDPSELVSSMFQQVDPKQFRFTPETAEALGQDTSPQLGVMAQDVEDAGPLGRSLVEPGPAGGKGLNADRSIGAALAAAADNEQRLSDLEKVLASRVRESR